MAPTLITTYTVNSNGSNNTTLSTPNFAPAANEFIVVSVTTYDSGSTVSGVSATANAPTFTARYSAAPASNGATYLWTTRITPALPVMMAIRATASGTAGYRQMVVSRWATATVNPSPAVGSASSSTTVSATVSTVGTNSVVVWASADWNGISPSGVAYRSGANALGAPYTAAEEFTGYSGYQTAASAGSQTFGLSAPTGQKAHLAAIELVTWTPIAATFAAQGSLNPNPTMQATLTGTGQLKVLNAAPPMVTFGRGKLTASPAVIRQALATLAGGGGLSLGGVPERAGATVLAGASALLAGLTRAHLVEAHLGATGALVIAGGLDTLTGPVTTAENVVGYFALRDLGLLTGDASYTQAADAIKASLRVNHWADRTQRFARGIGDESGSLMATALGGLFLTATGEHQRARAQIRHLRHYRVKNRSINGFHVDGPSGLQGYKPLGDGSLTTVGSTAGPAGPLVIDQAGSWLALLFASRFGEPIGEDIRSLARWRYNDDNSSFLYGAQWLRYSADSSALRARPYLGSAAWAYLLSQGAVGLLGPDPVALPVVISASLASSYDYGLRRLVLTAAWTRNTAPCAAYELVLESTTNNGSTWSQAQNTVRDSIERARVGNGYRYVWKLRMPANSATRYRVRVRLRNARFGSWVTSSTVVLPSV